MFGQSFQGWIRDSVPSISSYHPASNQAEKSAVCSDLHPPANAVYRRVRTAFQEGYERTLSEGQDLRLRSGTAFKLHLRRCLLRHRMGLASLGIVGISERTSITTRGERRCLSGCCGDVAVSCRYL